MREGRFGTFTCFVEQSFEPSTGASEFVEYDSDNLVKSLYYFDE